MERQHKHEAKVVCVGGDPLYDLYFHAHQTASAPSGLTTLSTCSLDVALQTTLPYSTHVQPQGDLIQNDVHSLNLLN